MTEEDEAFEDLAKRQGNWGMQGSRKHQIMRYAENVESKETSMTDKEAMAMALDALETEVSIDWTNNDEFNASAEKMHKAIAALKKQLAQPKQKPRAWLVEFENGDEELHFDEQSVGEIHMPLYTHPPQRTKKKNT